MQPRVRTLPPFYVVRCEIEATLKELESELGKSIYQELIARKDEIHNKKNDHIILMQIYPMNPDFNAQIDRFTQLLGCEVTEPVDIPVNMISREVAESKYAFYTHKGPESELSRTYSFLYDQWIRESGNETKDYDFEVWDERYKPESEDNEIDLYVALK